jgi:hypothetical protein
LIKGIRCAKCSKEFRWIDVPKKNRSGMTECICPHCDTAIRMVFPVLSIAALTIWAIMFLILLFWSILNLSRDTILVICFVGVVSGYVFPKIIFREGLVKSVCIDT